MNEELIEAIDKATVAHALWKVWLLDAVLGTGKPLDRKTAGDCYACEFGKWLDASRSTLASHPEYSSVFERHQKFHELVGAAIDNIGSGRSHEVRQSLDEDGALRMESSRMVLELLHWRDRLSGRSES